MKRTINISIVQTAFWGLLISLFSFALETGPLRADDDALSLQDVDFSKKRIAELVDLLDDDNPEIRSDACETLGKLGPEARTAIPKLTTLLADETRYWKYAQPRFVNSSGKDCLIAIGMESVTTLNNKFREQPASAQSFTIEVARMLGPRARALLPQFLKQYETAKDDDRAWLLSAIVAIDATGKSALPVLIKAIHQDESSKVRETAAIALTRSDFLEQVYWKERGSAGRWFRRSPGDVIGAMDALVKALEDKSPGVRGHAAISVSTYPEAAKRAVPLLIRLLADREDYSISYSNHIGGQTPVCNAAVLALSRFPTEADQSLPPLIQGAANQSIYPAECIAELVTHTKQPLGYLMQLLAGEHPETALVALARLGPVARPTRARLEVLTKSKDASVATNAKLALACIEPKGQSNSIKELLESDLDDVCYFVGSVGPQCSFVVSRLQEHLLDKEDPDDLNMTVLNAIGSIGPNAISAAQIVVERLATGFSLFAEIREEALYHFGPGVVPLLIDSLKMPEKSPAHRVGCLHVLARFGSRAADAVPVTIVQLDSEYPRVREAAVLALGAMASRPNESLPALQRMLTDPRPFVRAAATEGCGAFGVAAAPVVPALVKQLSDDFLDVRVAAASALGRLGPVAKTASSKLDELVNEENVLLRETVRDALAAIRKE